MKGGVETLQPQRYAGARSLTGAQGADLSPATAGDSLLLRLQYQHHHQATNVVAGEDLRKTSSAGAQESTARLAGTNEAGSGTTEMALHRVSSLTLSEHLQSLLFPLIEKCEYKSAQYKENNSHIF